MPRLAPVMNNVLPAKLGIDVLFPRNSESKRTADYSSVFIACFLLSSWYSGK